MKVVRVILALISLLAILSCQKQTSPPPLVIWVTGNLRSAWLPHAPYGEPPAGGLSRLARALELYRRPDDLLVDLGRFRYPPGISGDNRRWRVRSNGFLKALARMNYTALNVSLADVPPWPPELATRARAAGLPLLSSNLGQDSLLFPQVIQSTHGNTRVAVLGLTGGQSAFTSWLRAQPAISQEAAASDFTILVTDAPFRELQAFCDSLPGLNLVLWLNEGKPVARRVGETLLLGLGDQGNCLGRIEIAQSGAAIALADCDLRGWLDGKPYRHHPAREALLSRLRFGNKRAPLSAFLWQVPETLTPQKAAETQNRQTASELASYEDREDIHSRTSTDYAGPQRCLECHLLSHPRNLAALHLSPIREVQNYPVYERCLACHATGFEDPAGFLLPAERPDLLIVTCEACHGGSYAHALRGQPPFPPLPADSACGGCHNPPALPADHPR